jgi:hypothetical protein
MVVAARCLVLNPIVHHSRRPASCSARGLPRITATSASPLVALASMDAPPQGYRTNVGICLADPSLTKASPLFASRICPAP